MVVLLDSSRRYVANERRDTQRERVVDREAENREMVVRINNPDVEEMSPWSWQLSRCRHWQC